MEKCGDLPVYPMVTILAQHCAISPPDRLPAMVGVVYMPPDQSL